jgi:hypothetical protein
VAPELHSGFVNTAREIFRARSAGKDAWIKAAREAAASSGADEIKDAEEIVLKLKKNIGGHHPGFLQMMRDELPENPLAKGMRGIGFDIKNPYSGSAGLKWIVYDQNPRGSLAFEDDSAWMNRVEARFGASLLMHSEEVKGYQVSVFDTLIHSVHHG